MIYTVSDINNTEPNKNITDTSIFESKIREMFLNNETEKLSKLLGVLTLPILTKALSLVKEEDVVKGGLCDRISIPREKLIPVAISFIEMETFKELGDIEVTEALNYFIDEIENKKISKYYQKISF